ncbi:MAG: phosphatase [Planctomycetaceae bacterium]|nr:MAG: phosphatase [Planctomycetaceae bacterium]
MVEVCPLRGWRYDLSQVGELSDVVCPPYDVIDRALQDELYKRHPCNAIRLELNREEPGDASADARYQRAAAFWKQWRSDGILLQEHEEAFYVYHQHFAWEGTSYVRRGFLCRLKLEEFGRGHVFPHEQTLSGPKADRLALFHACRAHFSPVFGLYPDDDGGIQEQLDDAVRDQPPIEATDHLGVVNRLWTVTRPQVINAVRQALRERPIFIADGHHRYETSLNYCRSLGAIDPYHPARFVLIHCVGMSDPGLQILPTHRLVGGIPAWTAQEWQALLSPVFASEVMGTGAEGARATWEAMEIEGTQHVLGVGSRQDHTWLLARLQQPEWMERLVPQRSAAWRELAVSRLHELVLGHLLKQRLGDVAPQLRYVHRLEEVLSGLEEGFTAGWLVPPATIEHVKTIASGLETMPPKSTYFYPKLLTGMVFYSLQ